MRKTIFILGLSIAASAVGPAEAAGQIDQLKAGKLQCYGPNTTARTCAALSGYTFDGSAIMNQAEVLISPNPVGTMRTNSPVTFKGETICGVLAKKDIDDAVITSGGQVLGAAQAAGVKAQIWANMAPTVGKELCTTYTPGAGGTYATSYTLGGQPMTIPSTTVILVGPKDGYRVAP